MDDPVRLTADELALMADEKFFVAKAAITKKLRALLEALHRGLKSELEGVTLLTPDGFDLSKVQFVKGEHLEDFAYQYLDFPKHFDGDVKFTFRSLVWWGHHVVFALLLEGGPLARYKQRLIDRYRAIADQHLCLCLSPSLWEWRRGEGYTLPLTRDRRPEVSAVLAGRPFFKLARFVPFGDAAFREGRLVEIGRGTLRSLLPVITP